MPFVKDTDFPKVLHNTLQTSGPSPTTVVGDHQHWRLLCIDAQSNIVCYIDPMGTGFPLEIQGMMKAFYAKQDTITTWKHHVWKHKLQRDGHNSGIWAIWLNEQWMQYWNAAHENDTFELFRMQHMTPMPKGQTMRLHCHNMMQNAQTPDLSKQKDHLQDSPIQAPPQNRPPMTSETAQTLHATDAPTEAADETAHNVSQHKPKEGRTHETTHRHAEVPAGKHMYLKKQDKQYYQVHSLNALLGQKAVSPQDMVKCCQLETTFKTSLAGMLQTGWFHATNGNFNTQVINAWLHHYSQPTVRLVAIKTFIPAKSSKEDFTAVIPTGLSEFRVSWIAGDQADESLDYGHAVCVRKHLTTNKWYLLDSERPKPIEMNTTEWAKLRGTVEVLQKGSAYNHGMIWNAVQDGYPQFESEPSYIHAKDAYH